MKSLFLSILLLTFTSLGLEASISQIPSEETLQEIKKESPYSPNLMRAGDWWDDGPPAEGEGDGGFIGIPIEDDIFFSLFIASGYIIMVKIKNKRPKKPSS